MFAPLRNSFQQIFVLSQASNLLSQKQGPALALQEELGNKLTQDWLDNHVGPGWELAWGPAVWQPKSKKSRHPDNVWFVAKNESLFTNGTAASPVYVVCIAGSAGSSFRDYNWQAEDLAVGQIVNIQKWASHWSSRSVLSKPGKVASGATKKELNKPLLSYGTAQGVYVLASNAPVPLKSRLPVSVPCLALFFKSLRVTPDTRLVFTGHSLGGALAPSLAFILDKAGYLGNFAHDNILVYPTASASPGNQAFISAFSKRFNPMPPSKGQAPYMTWNQNIINLLDIVPHAWDTQATAELNLCALPRIYRNKPGDPVYKAVSRGVNWALIRSKNASPWSPFPSKPNMYVPLPCSTFLGTAPTSPPGELGKFPNPAPGTYLGIALQQHVDAYAELFKCPLLARIPPPGLVTYIAKLQSLSEQEAERFRLEEESGDANAWNQAFW